MKDNECGSEEMAQAHDEAILDCIFNPNMPYDPAAVLERRKKQKDGEAGGGGKKEPTEEEIEMKKMEFEGIKLAETGKFQEAIQCFDELLEKHPSYASGYNNRAQTFQLCERVEDALKDLEKAIEYGQNDNFVLRNAYTQRAMIEKLRGDDDAAKSDFEKAAELGGELAKMELVKMNPYAAMCNQMMSEVMHQLKKS
eukprot:Nk52_evm1s1149 gene=Nk52_evmTU1s1149